MALTVIYTLSTLKSEYGLNQNMEYHVFFIPQNENRKLPQTHLR